MRLPFSLHGFLRGWACMAAGPAIIGLVIFEIATDREIAPLEAWTISVLGMALLAGGYGMASRIRRRAGIGLLIGGSLLALDGLVLLITLAVLLRRGGGAAFVNRAQVWEVAGSFAPDEAGAWVLAAGMLVAGFCVAILGGVGIRISAQEQAEQDAEARHRAADAAVARARAEYWRAGRLSGRRAARTPRSEPMMRRRGRRGRDPR